MVSGRNKELRAGIIEAYQKQGVRQEGVKKHGPAEPAAGSLAGIDKLGHGNSHDDADKLIARVGNEVEKLGLVGDAQEVGAKLEHGKFKDDNDTGLGSGVSEKLGLELATKTSQEGGKQNVGNKSHDRDVHVRAVDVVARGQEPALLAIGTHGLLARPGLVSPGEEDEQQLGDDIAVGNVEVVFEGGEVDPSVGLNDDGKLQTTVT